MALLDVWPTDVVPAKEIKWWVTGSAAPGPRAIGGATRRGRTDAGGYWMCSMSGASLRNKDALRLGRVLEAICQGGTQEIIIPACECALAPWPGGVLPSDGVPHSDDTNFSDGTNYVSQVIDIRLAADADLRQPYLSVEVIASGNIRGGERFSLQHGYWRDGQKDKRLYTLVRAEDNIITIDPLLRADTGMIDADGLPTQLIFDDPGCVMRLTNPDEVMAAIRMNRFSELNAVFEEAF